MYQRKQLFIDSGNESIFFAYNSRAKALFCIICFLFRFILYFCWKNKSMEFEWDENKRIANLKKHGIDFAEVENVFEDECKITFLDNREDYGEERLITIGLVQNVLIVTVVYTERNTKTRIISARRAKKQERSLYYGNR